MRGVRSLIDALPLDPESRRPVDETWLDWETEAEAARAGGRSRLVRGFVGLRSMLGLGRALIGATGRELASWRAVSMAVRLHLFIGAAAFLLVVMTRLPNPEAVPYRYWPELLVARAVVPAPFLLPVGAFLAAATGGRTGRVPVLGFLALVSVTSFALLTIQAAASHHQHAVVYDLLMLERGFLEPGPIGLVDRSAADALATIGGSIRSRVGAVQLPVLLSLTAMAWLWGLTGLLTCRADGRRRRVLVMTGIAGYATLVAWPAIIRLVDPAVLSTLPTVGVRIAAAALLLATPYVVLPVVLFWWALRSVRLHGRIPA